MDDTEIERIVQKRIFSVVELDPFTGRKHLMSFTYLGFDGGSERRKRYEMKIDSLFELKRALQSYRAEMEQRGTWDNLIFLLWQTAPDDAVLSLSFLSYIADNIKRRLPYSSFGDSLSNILNAHSTITEVHWQQWHDVLMHMGQQSLLTTPLGQLE